MLPIKFPIIHIKIVAEKVLPIPIIIVFATQCWNPHKINKGIPSKIPSFVPFLYKSTATNIIAPHNIDLIKYDGVKPHITTLSFAILIRSTFVNENKYPNIYPDNKLTTQTIDSSK